jgi:hypothetical protein
MVFISFHWVSMGTNTKKNSKKEGEREDSRELRRPQNSSKLITEYEIFID